MLINSLSTHSLSFPVAFSTPKHQYQMDDGIIVQRYSNSTVERRIIFGPIIIEASLETWHLDCFPDIIVIAPCSSSGRNLRLPINDSSFLDDYQ